MFFVVVARLAAACALLLACLGCSSVDDAPQRGGELRVSQSRDIATLDPGSPQVAEILTFNVVRQLYEGLVEYDPATLAIVPRIAEHISSSNQERTWRFVLHTGARFIDDACFASGIGRKVVATDFKYSIERSLAYLRDSAGAAHLPKIRGLAEFISRQTDDVVGIRALDARTLELELEQPDSRLLHFLASPACFAVPREAVEQYGSRLRHHPVGSGPFRLVSWDALGIRAVRNRGYWRRDEHGVLLPYLDAIRWVHTSDRVAARMYSIGELDAFVNYAFDDVAFLDEQSAYLPHQKPETHFVTWLNTIFMSFNFRSDHPAVKDPLLRHALCCALPRASPSKHLPARGLFPPGLPGYDEQLRGQVTNLDSARAYLSRAGYTDPSELPPLRIVWPKYASGFGRDAAANFRALGFNVDFETLPIHEFAQEVAAGRADLFRQGWIADYPDPINFLQLFHSKSTFNRGGYSNARYDELMDELLAEADPKRAARIAREMERILVDDVAAVFNRHERQMQFVSPRVQNWETNAANPMNIRYYERIRLKSQDVQL